MKKIILNIILVLGLVNFATAQSVNLATGAPSVSIPLYTVTSGSLSLPIYLSYNVNGVGVAELPSEVGLSWKLNAGGSITQVPRGNANSVDYVFDIEDYYYYGISGSTANILQGIADAEPDLYLVDISGVAFKFYYDFQNKKFFTTENSNIKIEFFEATNNFSVGTFVITDENGIKYFFEELKYTINNFECGDEYPFPNAHEYYTFKWLLTKIESLNNSDIINLYYNNKSGDVNSEFLSTGKIITKSAMVSEEIGNKIFSNWTENRILKTSIDSIVTKNLTIDFDISNITENIYSSPYPNSELTPYNSSVSEFNNNKLDNVLKSLSVINKFDNKVIKTMYFDYEYPNNRILLTKLTEKNTLGEKLGFYGFDYYPGLPELHLNGIYSDFWGYFNNITDSALYNYSGRFPTDFVLNGMLKKISYPSGNYVEYSYENNEYSMDNDSNYWKNDDWAVLVNTYGVTNGIVRFYGPGVRVTKVLNSDGTKSYFTDYTYVNGRLTHYPILQYNLDYNYINSNIKKCIFKFQNDLNFEQGSIFYEKVIESKKGNSLSIQNGKIVYNYNVFPSNSIIYLNNFPLPINESNMLNGYLKSIEVFDSANVQLSRIDYNYTISKIVPSLILGLKAISINYNRTIGTCCYYSISQKNIVLNSVTKTNYDLTGYSISSTTTYLYDDLIDKNKLTSTETLNANNDIIKTTFYYPDNFSTPVFLAMKDSNIYAPVVKTETKINNLLISGSSTDYKFFGKFIVPSKQSIYEYAGNTWKDVLFYDLYDSDLNLLQSHTYDGIYSSTIYGYNNSLPIATVSNAKYSDIKYKNFEENARLIQTYSKTGNSCWEGTRSLTLPNSMGIFSITYWVSNDGINWTLVEDTWENPSGQSIDLNEDYNYIDDIRVHPIDAYMITTTYDKYFNKTSETDANNNTTYYEYDACGRVTKVMDRNKKIIQTYFYNFGDTER